MAAILPYVRLLVHARRAETEYDGKSRLVPVFNLAYAIRRRCSSSLRQYFASVAKYRVTAPAVRRL